MGNKVGGLKTAQINKAKDPDYYRKLGHMGGSATHTKPRGFAALPTERVSAIGKYGGSQPKRARISK